MARKPRWKLLVEKPDPRTDLETPAPDWYIQQHAPVQPMSEMEALMMTAPGDNEPETNQPDRGDTYENLDATLGVSLELNDIERSVLDALFVAGLSIRDAAQVLGTSPSTVWRIKESALARIRERYEWSTIGTGDTDHIEDRGDEESETSQVRPGTNDAVEEAG